MKKIFIAFCALIMSVLFVFSLVSCGNEEETTQSSVECKEHTYQHWVTVEEPFCNDPGIQTNECIKCHHKTQRNYVNKSKHEMVEGICIRCGFTTAPTDVVFELSEDGEYYILKSVEDKTAKEYYVPATYEGIVVREIAPGAFKGCKSLETVSIPNSIKTIGLGAFEGCYNIKSITVPFVGMDRSDDNPVFGYIFGNIKYNGSVGIEQTVDGVTKDYWLPQHLTDVTVTDGYLYEGCFENCTKLENIEYQGEATRIYDNAFDGCVSLQYVTLPETIEKVGDRAFQNCHSLRVIPLVEGIEEIGDYCFAGCKFEYLNLPNSLTDVGKYAFSACDFLTSIFIPKNISTLSEGMFQDCVELTSVEFENGVTTIGSNSFSGCKKLSSVIFPESMEEIGKMAFKDCIGLAEITVNAVTVKDGAFQNCTTLSKVTVGEGVEELKDYAFSFCSNLGEISIPSTLKTFGTNVFAECDKLTNIIIDENNKSFSHINGNIYSKNKDTLIFYSSGNKQESFVIPESVTTILGGAFDNAKFLQEVVFPASMKEIPDNLFLQNQTIRAIVFNGGIEKIGVKAFAGCTSLERVVIKNVGTIGEGAFTQCNMLKTIEIDGVGTIEKGAFYNCPSVTDITISNITEMEENIFAENYSLVNLTIGEGVATIGIEAFYKCTALKTLNIGASVVTIDEFAFAECTSLETVNTVYGLTTIGDAAFENCNKLSYFNISSSISNVTAYAFEGCTSLNEFVVSDASSYFDSVDGHLVSKSGSLIVFCPGKVTENITIPEGITSLGLYLFRNCKNLKSVSFPSTLTEIGNEAFYNSGLESIDLNGIQTIGEYAFGKCLSLKNVTVAKSVTTIMEYAFQDSIYIENFYVRNTLVNVGTAIFHVTDTLKKDLGITEVPKIYVYIEYDVLPETWDEGWNKGGNILYVMSHYFAD